MSLSLACITLVYYLGLKILVLYEFVLFCVGLFYSSLRHKQRCDVRWHNLPCLSPFAVKCHAVALEESLWNMRAWWNESRRSHCHWQWPKRPRQLHPHAIPLHIRIGGTTIWRWDLFVIPTSSTWRASIRHLLCRRMIWLRAEAEDQGSWRHKKHAWIGSVWWRWEWCDQAHGLRGSTCCITRSNLDPS